MRTISRVSLGVVFAMTAQLAGAAENYVYGRIVNVSFVGAEIYIKVDAGLPDNCAGTPFGWMVIPASGKAMAAFVTGLKLSGEMSVTSAYVYTTAPASPGGYCQVTQIDPND